MGSVSVHALSTGSLTLPERFFITPADLEAKRRVPSLSFLIQHECNTTKKVTRIVLDLGLRRDISLYPAVLQKHCHTRQPMTTEPDAVASLAKGGLSVDDIDLVIFSHVHYDHVGLPRDFTNPKTRFVVGPGALDLLSGKSALNIGSHSHFEAGLLPLDRTIELPPTDSSTSTIVQSSVPQLGPLSDPHWQSLPPFPHAIDIFNDHSVYIISAPGHLPGHINLLCRISNEISALASPSEYVLLAGDACHDIRLYTGERDIATWTDDEGRACCIHADIAQAKETISRLREAGTNGMTIPSFDGNSNVRANVEVVFAHNWAWEEDAIKRDRFWPGKL